MNEQSISNNGNIRRPPMSFTSDWGFAESDGKEEEPSSPSSPLRPTSSQATRPGSSLRPKTPASSFDTIAEETADAATAAAAAMLEAAAMQDVSSSTSPYQHDERNQAEYNQDDAGLLATERHIQHDTTNTDSTTTTTRQQTEISSNTNASTSSIQSTPQPQPQSHRQNTTNKTTTATTSLPNDSDDIGNRLLSRAASIMRSDNDLDTKVEGSSNHARVPNAETTGVATDAIKTLTLDERPRYSVIDEVVGQFVQGFQELERSMHLGRTKMDRDYLSRLAELQTRLLIEGDLGLSGGIEGISPKASVSSISSTTSNVSVDLNKQQKQELQNQLKYEALARDELLMSQLELHQGQVNDLVWSALAEKGNLQRQGARDLMDHAVTELRHCLDTLQLEGRKHADWLKKVCNSKIAAARVTGDTAYKQAERAAKTKYEYKMKLMRRHHADEVMDQEDNIGSELIEMREKATFYENKFNALERAQDGYMSRITSSEERAYNAEKNGEINKEQARVATMKARALTTELQSTADACAKAEKSNKRLQAKKEFLIEKLKKSQSKTTALEGDLAVRGEKLMALEEAIAAQNVNTAGVADRVKAEKEKQRLREIEVETLRSDCANAKTIAYRMKEKVKTLENNLNHTRTERDHLEEDVHHLTNDLELAAEKHSAYEVSVKEAKTEADQMRVQMMNTSKHHRRMSVQLNERVMQAHHAVTQVVKGMTSGPPPDFDGQHLSFVEEQSEWDPPDAGGSIVSPSLAMEETETRPTSAVVAEEKNEEQSKEQDKEDKEKENEENENKIEKPIEAISEEKEEEPEPEVPKTRTYEEIMWDRGAEEREAAAEELRKIEEAKAEELRQQAEEDAMMAALIASAEKAERKEKRSKKKGKSKSKKKSKPTKKTKKSKKSNGNESPIEEEPIEEEEVDDPYFGSGNGGGFTNNTRADLEEHGNTKWTVLRKKAASAMEHLKSHVKEADVPIEHTDAAGKSTKSNLVQMEKRLENELRGNIEKELRRKVQREFETKLNSGLRNRIQRELERKSKLALKKRIDAELVKIRLTPDETRDALDYERSRTFNLEAEVGDLQDHITELREESQNKDNGAAELALLVREKDMLLTEMTLLVRAYKEEVNIERAKVTAAQHRTTTLSSATIRSRPGSSSRSRPTSSKPSSRPQSSTPMSLLSSRSSGSSRPQSRQRPHTANPMVRERNGSNNNNEEENGLNRRDFENEREEEEEDKQKMMALRQVAPAPVKVAINQVQRMNQQSIQKRQLIAGQLGVGGGKRRRNKKDAHSDRPTTAPVQRKSGSGRSSVLSAASKQKRKALKSASHATRHSSKNNMHSQSRPQSSSSLTPSRSEYNNTNNTTSRPSSGTEPEQWAQQQQPYIPSALIRTSLRDGFVHSHSSSALQEPTLMQMSDSAPQLHRSGIGKGRPKSSPFIRFGSTGIQELIERKRRNLKSRG